MGSGSEIEYSLEDLEMLEQAQESLVYQHLQRIDQKIMLGSEAYEDLSKSARMFTSAYTFELEVSNGGLEQYFANPSGNEWKEVHEAFVAMQSRRILNIFERALSLFPENQPSSEQNERLKQMTAFSKRQVNLLDTLTGEYYSLYQEEPLEDFYQLAANYINDSSDDAS